MKEARKDSENVCASVSNSVQTQLENISTISMNIVYSNAIKQNFTEFTRSYQMAEEEPGMQVESQEKARAIHDIVTAIIGTYQSATQINIYSMDGSYVEAGYWLRTSEIDLQDMPWYEETMEKNGHKYFTDPITRTELPAQGDNQNSKKFISMTRTFFDSSKTPKGIVEVVQDCGKIFSFASQLESANPDSNVYIYNSRRELVYPYNRSVKEDYFSISEKNEVPEGSSRMVTAFDGDSYLYTWQFIPDYDWSVVLIKPASAVYGVLNNFRVIFWGIGAGSILVTMIICFYISKKLTKPLEKLAHEAGEITITKVLDEEKVNLSYENNNIIEISKLMESIQAMYEKLHATTKEFLLSQSEETRAKLQATQSLINPHFLYNCLTNVSVMAEEEMNDDIVHMCQALCDYFRYISSSDQMIVPLKEEIFYTVRYLECMKLRYGEELEYDLEISDDTSMLYIPKLILQPIVENTFKYAFNMSPPWKLNITSQLEGECWLIKITDNGGTLKDDKKEKLLKSFQDLDMNEELKSLKIGGMGLKNVYLRLKLLYGEKAVFKIENVLCEKTTFILGGPIYRKREEYDEHYPRL